ncbi:FAD-dependent 5-carboxymethylaminomethyl-2-thiouridine(34) oxidoreductase MnmC [Paracidovorax anthurii]|uniref:tRNA 5-methylaminomethyl-2-thiouridine biosynthesis bifunctional protein MnmC n=1 Tax=Paracidovorax anthurii TaxID=78229 RepID=A0A328Z109_9BURK|nr:FAD-dependent 5-carboxymethylaminomethyl-2-thiouridine(34) oxidoreductase MnmC [Paracidovorax anthurii]RAR79133.1 tRNA 5-methylaminomethyl-2-thiouridine biosynthesis bifunctional protein [Paracidovorax anthurii]
MSEPIDWLPDGTPYSPRFGDRYHSHTGLAQAREVFLHGCGLPGAWAGQPQWRVLETGFGCGLNFLATWAAWQADPARPRLLHFISCEAFPVAADDLLRATAGHPDLAPLARALHAQFWGLLPGVHRLAFEGGQVLLTLCIGDAQAMLRQQQPVADSVYLDGFSPQVNPDLWDPHTLKAVARCCRRGTRLATWCVAGAVRGALAQCGFHVQKVPGLPPKRSNLQAVFDPAWEPRPSRPDLPDVQVQGAPSQALVIGGGLSGAAVAASLARRGWQVRVLDEAMEPAAGASGLPAGVFAPHVSPDDSLLSRLSRCGVRATLQAVAPLTEGEDWSACGVLEHEVDGKSRLPAAWAHGAGAGAEWSRPADAAALAAAGLPPGTVAYWHVRGGWIRPARLVNALLDHPAIAWQGGSAVARLERVPSPGGGTRWQALDGNGALLAEAPHVVIAAGYGSRPWLPARYPIHPLRGQVSWGPRAQGPVAAWPPFPVNGHGNLVPQAGPPDGAIWVMGSTFERGQTGLPPAPEEQAGAHAANAVKLERLLPALAQGLAPAIAGPGAAPGHWAAVRCTAPDRLPFVGPVDAAGQPGLWVCAAMGARGLTLSQLCGELLAARMAGEPLPVDVRLARALSTERLSGA